MKGEKDMPVRRVAGMTDTQRIAAARAQSRRREERNTARRVSNGGNGG